MAVEQVTFSCAQPYRSQKSQHGMHFLTSALFLYFYAVLHPVYLPCELRLIQNTAVVLCKEKRNHLVSFFVWSLYLLINL